MHRLPAISYNSININDKGEPNMKGTLKYTGPAFLIALLAACATSPWETINVPINAKGWKMDYTKKARGTGWIKEYVRPPETVADWTRLITLQFFDGVHTRPRAFMDHMEAILKNQCPNVSWRVINGDKKRILYEWEIQNCPGHHDQHEISLLLTGDYGLYRAAYTQRGSSMSPATRTQWVKWLNSARIIKADD